MIVLCADDYGLADGVSRGILELADSKRLSATSAMVTFDRWAQDAERLSAIHDTTALGLHLNLTLGAPLVASNGHHVSSVDGSLLPLRKLTYQALTRRLDPEAISQECKAQIARFHDGAGMLPDFIDGHQHVHGLPVISEALVKAVETFNWSRPPLIRIPSSTSSSIVSFSSIDRKAALVTGLTRGLKAKIVDAHLPINETFAGFSDFLPGTDYRNELKHALKAASSKCHLVMCHPGYVDDELRQCGDLLIERREEELSGLLRFDGLAELIWHPEREPSGAIDWAKAMKE